MVFINEKSTLRCLQRAFTILFQYFVLDTKCCIKRNDFLFILKAKILADSLIAYSERKARAFARASHRHSFT